MQLVINLDENSNFVSKCIFIQDIREVCPKCCVTVMLPERVGFIEGYCFFYMGVLWDVVSYKEISRGTEFIYSLMGYPASICKRVISKYVDVSSLASGLGLHFGSDYYTNFEFEFPIHNVPLGVLLYKYRKASFEKYFRDPAQAWYLSYDMQGLVSCTFRDLLSSDVIEFPLDAVLFAGGHYTFVRDYLNIRYTVDHPPSPISYKSWMMHMIGDKFDVHTNAGGVLGFKYILTNGDEDLSEYDNLILVRQRYDSSKGSSPWTLTFGQFLVE